MASATATSITSSIHPAAQIAFALPHPPFASAE